MQQRGEGSRASVRPRKYGSSHVHKFALRSQVHVCMRDLKKYEL